MQNYFKTFQDYQYGRKEALRVK